MRPIILASVLLGSVALLLVVSTVWSEPSWLLVWGAVLISASFQLRADFSRRAATAPALVPFSAAQVGAQIGRTAPQSVPLDGIRANT